MEWKICFGFSLLKCFSGCFHCATCEWGARDFRGADKRTECHNLVITSQSVINLLSRLLCHQFNHLITLFYHFSSLSINDWREGEWVGYRTNQ